jgi:hypothetical protein
VHSGSDLPHCVTPILDPHANYSILACEATKDFYRVHLTFSGQTTTGYLPRYLGEDGSVTYGTRIPKNSTTTSISVPSSLLSANTDFGVGTIIVVTTREAVGQGNGGGGGQVNTVLVVGVVLGGGIAVTAVVVLGVSVWVYRRGRVRGKVGQGSEGGDGRDGTELRNRGAEVQHALQAP